MRFLPIQTQLLVANYIPKALLFIEKEFLHVFGVTFCHPAVALRRRDTSRLRQTSRNALKPLDDRFWSLTRDRLLSRMALSCAL